MAYKPFEVAGKFLRQTREASGRSQQEVGALINRSRQSIMNWENGYVAVPQRQLSALAAAYGIEESKIQEIYKINGTDTSIPSTPSKNLLPLLKAIVKSGRDSITTTDLNFLIGINNQLESMPESLVRELLENRKS